MTLLLLLKPIYQPTGVGTFTTSHGRAPKKRRKKKRELDLLPSPDFSKMYDDEQLKLLRFQESRALKLFRAFKRQLREMEDHILHILKIDEWDD